MLFTYVCVLYRCTYVRLSEGGQRALRAGSRHLPAPLAPAGSRLFSPRPGRMAAITCGSRGFQPRECQTLLWCQSASSTTAEEGSVGTPTLIPGCRDPQSLTPPCRAGGAAGPGGRGSRRGGASSRFSRQRRCRGAGAGAAVRGGAGARCGAARGGGQGRAGGAGPAEPRPRRIQVDRSGFYLSPSASLRGGSGSCAVSCSRRKRQC